MIQIIDLLFVWAFFILGITQVYSTSNLRALQTACENDLKTTSLQLALVLNNDFKNANVAAAFGLPILSLFKQGTELIGILGQGVVQADKTVKDMTVLANFGKAASLATAVTEASKLTFQANVSAYKGLTEGFLTTIDKKTFDWKQDNTTGKMLVIPSKHSFKLTEDDKKVIKQLSTFDGLVLFVTDTAESQKAFVDDIGNMPNVEILLVADFFTAPKLDLTEVKTIFCDVFKIKIANSKLEATTKPDQNQGTTENKPSPAVSPTEPSATTDTKLECKDITIQKKIELGFVLSNDASVTSVISTLATSMIKDFKSAVVGAVAQNVTGLKSPVLVSDFQIIDLFLTKLATADSYKYSPPQVLTFKHLDEFVTNQTYFNWTKVTQNEDNSVKTFKLLIVPSIHNFNSSAYAPTVLSNLNKQLQDNNIHLLFLTETEDQAKLFNTEFGSNSNANAYVLPGISKSSVNYTKALDSLICELASSAFNLSAALILAATLFFWNIY